MGVEVSVENLTKSFGSQNIWRDVSLTLPTGEVSALLGPSGTGKSVFLKTLIGLLHPEQGTVTIDGTDITQCSSKELYEIRKLFGVLFQDGALFGSMSLFDNIAFPLREHTKKKEGEVKDIVMEKIDLVGLTGAEDKLPGEISGGMRKRAGLARALVLDPQIILCDEPDSGLDPVRTAYISQLLIDINAQIDATILIVTHNINIARTIPDNIGMLFRKELVMFGPREQLLTSEQPVVKQFLSGDRFGPIGMSEEKDEAVQKQEEAMQAAGIGGGGTKDDFSEIIPQVQPNPGMPERKAIGRHRERVLELLPTLPENAQRAIRESMQQEDEMREEARRNDVQQAAESGAGQVGSGQAPSQQDGGDQGEWTSTPEGQQGGVGTMADQRTETIDYGGGYGDHSQGRGWSDSTGDAQTQPIQTQRDDVGPRHHGRSHQG